jgi:hypothetical protein
LQSLKLAVPSTTWRHFRSIRKWGDTMLPELLWAFLQELQMSILYHPFNCSECLELTQADVQWIGWMAWLPQSFSRRFSLLVALLWHMNCPYAPLESAPLWDWHFLSWLGWKPEVDD